MQRLQVQSYEGWRQHLIPAFKTSLQDQSMLETCKTLSVKLLSINVHKGVGQFFRQPIITRLNQAIASVDVDVVCLQEVLGSRDGQTPQYEALADSIWSEHAYGRNAVGPTGDHGNAILSRWPIAAKRNHDVSQPGDEARGILHCQLALPGAVQGLHVLCVHLGLRESHREKQIARLLELLAKLPADAPVVVAGDFNDWLQKVDARLKPAGLREVHVHKHGRPARSFPAIWPVLALDRIYVRGVAAAQPLFLSRKPWWALSDHVPVGAELSLHKEIA